MFQESFYMFKALKKSMWTSGFFVSTILFPYQMFTKIVSIFLWTLIYSTRIDPCVQNIQKNKNTYTLLDFNTWMSLNIIIVLNL
jgi:hypothetical protein